MADNDLTPKPQEGNWTLTAPDGRTWEADAPLRCVAAEQRERVPATVRLQRILDAADDAADDASYELGLLLNHIHNDHGQYVQRQGWRRAAADALAKLSAVEKENGNV